MNPQIPRNISIDHWRCPFGSANARVEERCRGLERERAMKDTNMHQMAK